MLYGARDEAERGPGVPLYVGEGQLGEGAAGAHRASERKQYLLTGQLSRAAQRRGRG